MVGIDMECHEFLQHIGVRDHRNSKYIIEYEVTDATKNLDPVSRYEKIMRRRDYEEFQLRAGSSYPGDSDLYPFWNEVRWQHLRKSKQFVHSFIHSMKLSLYRIQE